MILAFIMFPILFSFLYQLSSEEQLTFKYFLQRSTCDHCHQPLRFYNLIPILSFCGQKGRTSCCRQRLSIYYFIGECLAMAGALLLYWQLPISRSLFIALFLLLLTTAISDIATLTISLNLLFVFVVACCVLFHCEWLQFLIVLLISHILFFIVRSGIGYGDILLINFLALFLPFHLFTYVLLFTFIFAGLFAVIVILSGYYRRRLMIPLVPFIFSAFCFVMVSYTTLLFGGEIL
ncbi:prepilin peptidase [Staphylococcus argensis]|uniref:Signal peptidase n=2 Tax=Staphylococcus argensis TaxID=1607738 RepID=A0A2K4FGV8_9STAP|nr:prepilin peptidase [Staphylococcus argensis]POA10165.1 signal peptidase [Staphylococcus argensis]